MILTKKELEKTRIKMQQAFNQMKFENQACKYEQKLQNAASMVDNMSRFSRGFISLNYLSTVIARNS